MHYANFALHITGFSFEFRLHFAGGKSITAKQYIVERIELVGRLRDDGSHEGLELDRKRHEKMNRKSGWVSKGHLK